MSEGKKILVVGVDETDRDSLVEMTLKGNKKLFPRLALATLPDISRVSSFTELKQKRSTFQEKFSPFLSRKGTLVMTGTLAAKTPMGYSPLFTNDLLQMLKPDLTVLLELDTREALILPEYGIMKRKVDRTEVRVLQQLNRQYAALLFGTLCVLRIDKKNIKKTLRELKDVLRTALAV